METAEFFMLKKVWGILLSTKPSSVSVINLQMTICLFQKGKQEWEFGVSSAS